MLELGDTDSALESTRHLSILHLAVATTSHAVHAMPEHVLKSHLIFELARFAKGHDTEQSSLDDRAGLVQSRPLRAFAIRVLDISHVDVMSCRDADVVVPILQLQRICRVAPDRVLLAAFRWHY